jgi:hypothetical protein
MAARRLHQLTDLQGYARVAVRTGPAKTLARLQEQLTAV